MSKTVILKPANKHIHTYYEALRRYGAKYVEHEGALETAFQRLLSDTARIKEWTLIPKQKRKQNGKFIFPDGTLRDDFNLPRGFWEAKDTHDDLDVEIKKKIEKGYPLSNTIFEDTRQAVLYQAGKEKLRFDLSSPQELCDLLNEFFAYTEPDIEGFEQAIGEFKDRVPELASGLMDKILDAHKRDKGFQAAFDDFFTICQQSLNPKIKRDEVDEMLIQHLLTERLIRKIFDNPEFAQRNVIATEVERVINALVSHSFNRDEFLKSLDRFYRAIEEAAHSIDDFNEKQHFLNTVYERFFQSYSVKLADTHGIVYTPQAIVDFMCSSIERVLKDHFDLTLGSPMVNILDPCTGTGNFVVNLLRRISKRNLPRAYREQLFANEIMLLPYYVSSLNIEHAFAELAGFYEPFEGLCFVDTLELAEGKQQSLSFMSEANTARVERQKRTPIKVIIGNPPYNMGQKSESDNNKNRSYEVIDKRIHDTYVKDSTATLKNKYYDPYIRFFRWAVDRLNGQPGIVCYVSNNKFVDTLDGMQKHLLKDFTRIYHIDLHGDINLDRSLSGTVHNVFGIKVGVGITVAVREAGKRDDDHSLHYFRVPDRWTRSQKLSWLADQKDISTINWEVHPPHKWIELETAASFAALVPLGSKEAKALVKGRAGELAQTIFKVYTVGVLTARDPVVYDFDKGVLLTRMEKVIDDYNGEVDRFNRAQSKQTELIDVDTFVKTDLLRWTHNLKNALAQKHYLSMEPSKAIRSLYRPFTKKWLYFDRLLNERVYLTPSLFPGANDVGDNLVICCTSHTQMPFACMVTDCLPNEAVGGRNGQCFAFYSYSKDGGTRTENITNWALERFRKQYHDPKITKKDIFHYVYAALHHPGHRATFAKNLQRELPRIPFLKDFKQFAKAGKNLTALHIGYESLAPWKLDWIHTKGIPLSCYVEKMRLNKERTTLLVNDSLALGNIPSEAFEYHIGNRSALEWVIDQYSVEVSKEGFVSDPNKADDPEYIVRLVGQIVRVSVETMRILSELMD